MTRISPSTSSGGEAVGILDMGLFEAKPARFEVGEHGLDAPAISISQGGQISRLGRHGDDPGLGMSGIANDADVGRDPLAGESDSFKIVAAGQSEVAGGGFCRAAADSPPRDRDTSGSSRGFRRSGQRAEPRSDPQAASRRPPRAALVAWRS